MVLLANMSICLLVSSCKQVNCFTYISVDEIIRMLLFSRFSLTRVIALDICRSHPTGAFEIPRTKKDKTGKIEHTSRPLCRTPLFDVWTSYEGKTLEEDQSCVTFLSCLHGKSTNILGQPNCLCGKAY